MTNERTEYSLTDGWSVGSMFNVYGWYSMNYHMAHCQYELIADELFRTVSINTERNVKLKHKNESYLRIWHLISFSDSQMRHCVSDASFILSKRHSLTNLRYGWQSRTTKPSMTQPQSSNQQVSYDGISYGNVHIENYSTPSSSRIHGKVASSMHRADELVSST